jgi:alkylation response protein AidB-like acyl-CoA dehydrogenase
VNVVAAAAGTHHRTSMLPVTQFTEDEQMVRDAARIWANEELKPIVRDMDDECKTRPEVIQSLFEHGFMGMVRCMSCNYIVCY